MDLSGGPKSKEGISYYKANPAILQHLQSEM